MAKYKALALATACADVDIELVGRPEPNYAAKALMLERV